MKPLWLAVLLVSCTSIDARRYDKACAEDGDCVVVFSGDVCGGCPCGNSAINKRDLADFQRDQEAAGELCIGAPSSTCECPARTALCSERVCTFQ